ncbi:MAG: class I SAM-dependent methyltransferase [Ignavibacteriaceae bacterium]
MTEYLNSNFKLKSDKSIDLLDELPLWSAPFGLKLLDKIKFIKGITALDIGFGTGFPLTELAMRLGNSCKVIGLDPWKTAIKRTNKKIQFYGINNIEITEGSAENIPLDNNSIDLIVSNNGLNNVNNLEKALSECSRIIKNKGQFIQTINLDSTMIEFYDIFGTLLFELNMKSELEKMKTHIYKKRKPLDEFLEKIEKNGFVIKEVEKDKFEYKFTDGTTMFNHYFIRLAFLNEWKKIIPVERQSQIFKEVELRINKKSETDGLFKLSVPFVVIDAEKN